MVIGPKHPPAHSVGSWVVVLGGSSGIGLACAEEFVSRGINVVAVHRDFRSRTEELDRIWGRLRSYDADLLTFNRDAVNLASMNDLIGEFKEVLVPGSVRMLIHSISKGNLKRMNPGDDQRMRRQDLELTLSAMSWSLYDWTMGLLEADLFSTDARILGLSSEGTRKIWPYYAAVANAKSSMESLIRHMAYELAPKGIRVNGIRAGITRTPSLDRIPGHEQLLSDAERRNPSGRITRPEDVARVAYLLSTEEAYWINGAIVPVDGGEGLQ